MPSATLAIAEPTRLEGPIIADAAAPPNGFVVGGGQYDVPQSPFPRSVRVSARPDPETPIGTGQWSWNAHGRGFSGTVTCLVFEGADAWLAGPVMAGSGGHEAMFLWVHDGGSSGDTAFMWIADPGETLADMVGHCLSREDDTLAAFGVQGPYPVANGSFRVSTP